MRAVAVWVMESLLYQITVDPTGTVSIDGLKANPSIATSIVGGMDGGAPGDGALGSPGLGAGGAGVGAGVGVGVGDCVWQATSPEVKVNIKSKSMISEPLHLVIFSKWLFIANLLTPERTYILLYLCNHTDFCYIA